MSACEPAVHLAFRFHVNFYHSYRGDSLDERGIGKDIRIITSTLDDLDRLNAEGVPVRGTWDIENYFSLQYLMRRHAPELIDRIAGRVRDGRDEVEPMSYNNGIVSACTDEEFAEQARLMVTNEGGSGLSDLFAGWKPILRPQECMYTPSFLTRYPSAGIPAVSLYYSAVPFNAFSTFVAPLGFAERYNPLTLTSGSCPGSMTLLPAYNHGDVADHWLSLRRWVQSLRRRQLRTAGPGDARSGGTPPDLLLLIDADADDDFWAGVPVPFVTRVLPSFDGLYRLVRSVSDLPYVRFTRPADYLETHPPVGTVVLDQDTADGSHDGLSSWAEKWENTELWTLIQRARDLSDYAHWLAAGFAARTADASAPSDARLAEALHERLLAMSTTHFGMASPVMNGERLEEGFAHARRAVELAGSAVDRAGAGGLPHGALLFPAGLEAPEVAGYVPVPDATDRGREFEWIALAAGERTLAAGERTLAAGERAAVPRARPPDGRALADVPDFPFDVLDPWVTWGRRRVGGRVDSVTETELPGGGRCREVSGTLRLPVGAAGEWRRTETVLPGSDALYLTVEIRYPETPHVGYDRGKAGRLNRTWDHRWKEVAPLEIVPRFAADGAEPFRVVKHNFFGDVSSYALDYHRYSANRRIDSFNNHITNAWVAITDGSRGLLVAQQTAESSNFAFCPMRSSIRGGRQHLRLNPFGTYHGAQLRYPTAVTGVGRAMALLMADQLDSYAPSYNGRTSRFSIAVFPFEGPAPPEGVRRRAELYAASPLLLG